MVSFEMLKGYLRLLNKLLSKLNIFNCIIPLTRTANGFARSWLLKTGADGNPIFEDGWQRVMEIY